MTVDAHNDRGDLGEQRVQRGLGMIEGALVSYNTDSRALRFWAHKVRQAL